MGGRLKISTVRVIIWALPSVYLKKMTKNVLEVLLARNGNLQRKPFLSKIPQHSSLTLLTKHIFQSSKLKKQLDVTRSMALNSGSPHVQILNL
jgi:hypothetical protein